MPLVTLPAFYDMVYCNKENGRLAPDGYLYNDQTFQTLNAAVILLNDISTISVSQGAITVNGLNPPSLTGAQITAAIADTTNPPPLGTIWYNTDINQLQFLKPSGVISTITSVP